ncbi:MAG: hypothetical protein EAZ66_02540 [Alphaproteobacteria bacterium]|nr:MAG: hypothetical protein EAZ66_02540 [Alphaproteobacteria bacterium]
MSRRSSVYCSLLSVSTILASASLSYASATKIGIIAAADSTVNIVSASGEQRVVKIGDPIFAQDRIITDASGKAQLVFADRTTITVNEGAELLIDKFVYDPQAHKGVMNVSAVKGAFRFIGGALSKQNPIELRTPVSTIGIRGGIGDAIIQPNGETRALFHFGEQMTMTNQQGDALQITTSGTGASLATGDAQPQMLTPAQVQQTMQIASPSWNGGGVATTPTEQSITPALNAIESEQQTPIPSDSSPSPAPTSSAAPSFTEASTFEGWESQESAPIVMIDDANASVIGIDTPMDASIAGMDRPIGAQEQQIAVQQAATENPELLQAIVTQEAFDRARPFIEPPIVENDPPPPPIAEAENDPPPPAPPPPPIAENVPPPPPPPAPIIAQAEPSISGWYASQRAFSTGGTFFTLDQGIVADVTSTPTSYRVMLDSNATIPNREIRVPKLTQTGSNAPVSRTVTADGIEETRTIRGFKSRGGALSYYDITRSGDDTVDDKKLHLTMGTDIFSHGVSGTTAYSQAAIASRTATTATNPLHGAHTNGIVMYDFLNALDMSSVTGGMATYGMHEGLHSPYAAPFGMAVDWSEGKIVTGAMQWHTGGSTAYAIGGHAQAANAPHSYLMAGRQMHYAQPTNVTSGGFNSLAVFGVDNMYNTPNGMVEALTMESRSPNFMHNFTGETPLSNALDPVTSFASLRTTAASVKIGSIATNVALTRQMQAPRPAGLQEGFAAGVIMRHDGTNYVPKIVASDPTFGVSDVSMSDVSDHKEAFIRVYDTIYDPTATNILDYDQNNFSYSYFEEANGMGAYINDQLYMLQNRDAFNFHHTSGTIFTNVANGMIMSAAFDPQRRATIPTDYQCTDCEFVHWGVWAGEAGRSSNPTTMPQDHAAMIPFMMGQRITSASALPLNVTATYKGEAYATIIPASQLPRNISGTILVTANLNGADTAITSLNLNFGTVENAPLNMEKESPSGLSIAPFNSQYTTTLAKTGGNTTTSDDIAGHISGAFYGSQGQEIGGNYFFRRGDGLTGAGIYLGKQRP